MLYSFERKSWQKKTHILSQIFFFLCSVTLLSTFNSANMLKLWTCGLFAYGFIKPFVCKMTAPKLQVHCVNSGMVIVYYIAIIISYKGITFVWMHVIFVEYATFLPSHQHFFSADVLQLFFILELVKRLLEREKRENWTMFNTIFCCCCDFPLVPNLIPITVEPHQQFILNYGIIQGKFAISHLK